MNAPFATIFRRAVSGLAGLGVCLLVGCATRAGDPAVRNESIRTLQESLSGLAPIVNRAEAERAARSAVDYSLELAREYRVARPALFHNALVNLRLKNRGLCHHWAADLLTHLRAENLSTLQLRWGIARAGTLREHNCIVITARDDLFERGLVLDAWRHSGRLFWGPVVTDRYPWEEGELDPPPVEAVMESTFNTGPAVQD